MTFWKGLYLFVLLAMISACSDDGAQTERQETPYYPLAVGAERIYEIVEHTIHVASQSIDTNRYQLRENIIELTQDDQTGMYYIIDRYRRSESTDQWGYHDRIRARVGDDEVIVQEANFRYVRLVLPIKVGQQWDALRYFDRDVSRSLGGADIAYFKGWQSQILSEDAGYTYGGISVSDVITVQHADMANRIERRYVMEQYAPHIGLVSRDIEIFDTQCFDDCPDAWLDKADKGHRITQRLISYR